MRSKLFKKIQILKGILATVSFLVCGCGVKGDPKPPETPSYMGTGQPTYRKAAEKIPLQNYSPAEDEEQERKEPEDE